MHRRTPPWPASAYLACAVLLAGCGESGASSAAPGDPSEPSVDEVAAHSGEVCPEKLPQAPETSHGFGTGDAAESAPSLPAPEEAWVCQYVAKGIGPGPDGDGTTFAWVREGPARDVPDSRLATLADQLSELVPADGQRACTADLGPRWMLVYAAGNDLTGVVVDGFGCQDIRLTDEPFRTVPGEATRNGTVPGVLTGPDELLTQLATGRGRRS